MEGFFIEPTQEQIDLYNSLLPIANPAHRNQAELLARYDVGAAGRYLDLMLSEQYRKRKAFSYFLLKNATELDS